jgi:MFS family permease
VGAPEPVDRVPAAWTARFGLLWLGVWAGWLVPVQLLLPEQLADLDPAHKVRDFAVVNGLAGVAALLALPVCGALCDRTRSRFGRRRVWMAAGVAAFALCLAATGAAGSWGVVALCWTGASIGLSAASAGLFAAVADRVPDRQRGVVSGAIFGPQALGILLGLVVCTQWVTSSLGGYLAMTALLCVLAVPFVLRYEEAAAPAAGGPAGRPGLRELTAGIGVSPRRHPDFAWAFGARVMVNVGNALGTTYLLYFFTDDLHLPDPDTALLFTTAIYLVCTLLATFVGGALSDRSGRRRVFVAVAALLQSVAALLLVLRPALSTAEVAAGFIGAGYGAFLAVDQALVTQVLPDAGSRAKDLGIMNVGNNAPQALAPVAAAGIISQLGGYGTLFAAAGVCSIVGALMVRRVRGVR